MEKILRGGFSGVTPFTFKGKGFPLIDHNVLGGK
jgi:hypothetical protein